MKKKAAPAKKGGAKKATPKKAAPKKVAAKKVAPKKSGKAKATTPAKKVTTKTTSSPKKKKSAELIESIKVKKSYITGQTFGMKEVKYSVVNGMAMFEGDIVLGTEKEMDEIRKNIENPDTSMERAVALSGGNFRWPAGIIIYRIAANLTNQARVTDAIAHIAANTNLRFRVRTNEANFITFRTSTGCSSAVGMRGGEQFINLGPGCTTGNCIHEILHAAGIWHEQSREDRDNFVTIHFNNVIQGLEHNFNQHITDGDDIGGYDYGSIMHYPRNAFARNSTQDTITPKPNPSTAIGQRTGMSAGDIRAINALYPSKTILGDTSSNGPSLTTKASTVLLGWTGAGNLRLNFMSSSNGLNYANKVSLNETSPVALGLTAFNNKFIVAWVGVGNNRINIMQSTNGLNWTNKVTLADTSMSSPALTVFNNRIYLAWRGVGNNRLNVMSSTDGVNWGGKVTLADTTTSGPSLCALGTRLLIAWRGDGNNRINVMRSTNGTAFTGKVILNETTTSKPQLFAINNVAGLTWQGIGNNLLNMLISSNGTSWGNKFISTETCIDGPAMTNLGTRIVWGWTGTDAAHRLNAILFTFLV